MNLEIKQILNSVKKAKCKNESAATLWLVAAMSGLDESLVPIEDIDIQKLSRAGLLNRDKQGIVINLNFDSNIEVTDDQIEEYRQLWKGLFTGSMGSAESIKSKLIRWLSNNPRYDVNDVIKAANYWIESKKREVNDPGLIGQADYFIYKKVGKDEQSRLSSVVDEAKNAVFEEDWNNTIV